MRCSLCRFVQFMSIFNLEYCDSVGCMTLSFYLSKPSYVVFERIESSVAYHKVKVKYG